MSKPQVSSFDREFRPIAVVAIALVLFPLVASAYFLFHPTSPFVFTRLQKEGFYAPMYFFAAVNMIFGAMCFGVLSRKKWGYRLFQILLYALLFGFPIGTVVSYSTLSYVRRHGIERYFGLRPSNTGFALRTPVMILGAAAVVLYLWMMLAY